MITRLYCGYRVARQFGRGHLFSALMGLSYMARKRTPKYRIY